MSEAMNVLVKVEDSIAEDRESRDADDVLSLLTEEERQAIAAVQYPTI
jgi:hypothetical protein